MKDVLENVEINATANAETKDKTAIWANKIDVDTATILDGMMENFESWNSNFRTELVKRDCLDVIKYQHDRSSTDGLLRSFLKTLLHFC